MPQYPVAYLLKDNEGTQLGGIQKTAVPGGKVKLLSWELGKTCLN